MYNKSLFATFFILVLAFQGAACAEGTKTRKRSTFKAAGLQNTSDSPPQTASVNGPACPGAFRESRRIVGAVKIASGDSFTVRLGSTPSIPCGWQAPEISNLTAVRQVEHRRQWPAEGVTPKPGAPGTEIWEFEAVKRGDCTMSFRCTCLGEKGKGKELTGVYGLKVSIKN